MVWRRELGPENYDPVSNSLPQWILDYAKDQYGVDMNNDLGQGKEVPEKDPRFSGDLDEDQTIPSWWSTHWRDMVVIGAGLLVVGILIAATIMMRLL